MKECNDNFIPFNHNYLCQMLRSASNNKLNDIIKDVQKERERRYNIEIEEYRNKIFKAIKDAIDAGHSIAFYQNSASNYAEYLIDKNDVPSLNVELE